MAPRTEQASAPSIGNLSRRQFAALIGIGMAAIPLSSLVGCAPKGSDHTDTLDYDVVVIGSGGAGTSAAALAAQQGARTLCIEKLPFQAGSSSLALGTLYGAGTVQQRELGIKDTPDDLYAYFLTRGADKVSLAMNRFMADHAGETIDWLREDLQVPFKDTIKGNGLDKVQRGHMCLNSADDALKAVRNLADEQGVEFRFDTTATSLVLDDSTGKVVGVKAHTPLGATLIHAKTVVIASGGFCRNQDMIATYCPDYAGVYTEVGVGSDGNGLQMGLDIGASYVGNGGTNGILSCAVDAGQSALIDSKALWVNSTGNRFANEGGQTHDIFYTVAEYADRKFYAVYDQTMVNALSADLKSKFDFGIEQGIFVKGATVAEAAEKLNINGTAVQAALDEYNAMAIAKHDTRFGKSASLLAPITQPPFYLLTMGICTHGSFGGLETNTQFQVKNTEGDIISGLYAAGEVCCGTFIYQDYPAGGCGLDFSYTSGRFAGTNAANEAMEV